MSGSWNEPLPLMDQAMCDRMVEKTNEYLQLINWRNDGNPENLQHAVALAKVGIDGGRERTMALRPTSRIFSEWMDWNSLVTYLFNRETQYERTLLSALRNAISKSRDKLILIYFLYKILLKI